MSHTHRFPQEDAQFNQYLQRAVPHLLTNWDRLVPPPVPPVGGAAPAAPPTDPHRTELEEKYNEWNGTAAAPGIYPLSQNPDVRTKTITKEKDDLRDELEFLLRDIYEDIPNSWLTPSDREILNLPERDTEPSPRPKIETAPFLELTPLSGSEIEIAARVIHDSTRASMQPDADVVELKVKIGSAPASVNDMALFGTSKKALFTILAGLENGGKRIYIAARWKNESNPEKSGPWSTIYNAIIIT